MDIQDTNNRINFSDSNVAKFYGIYMVGKDTKDVFWRIKCSCGVEVVYPMNGLPEVTTKHPCENPDHWTVMITELMN